MRKKQRNEKKKNRQTLLFIIFLLMITGCVCNKDPENAFDSAIKLWSEGKYEKSKKAFETFIDLYPNHPLTPKAFFWIGDIQYIYLNDPLQALYSYRRIVKKYLKSEYAPKAQWKIAKILCEDLLEKSRCIKEYQIFIKLFPKHPRAANAQYNIAEAYAYLDDYRQAITEFEFFLSKYPDSEIKTKIFHRLGELYSLVEIFPKAIHFLNKAYESSKEEMMRQQVKKTLAECYASKGDLSKSLGIYEEIIKEEPDNEILRKRVESLRSRLKIVDITKKDGW